MPELVESPTPESPTPAEPTPIEQAESVQDHAARYGPDAASDPEPTPPPKPDAQQRRDRDTGQYQSGKVRHRAKSSQATADDVPRIRELTAKQRAAEERATQLEQELARYRQPPAAPAPPPAPQASSAVAPRTDTVRPIPMAADPEPQDTDDKYASDYAQYLTDHARWAARDEFRRARHLEAQQQQYHARVSTFQQRVQATKARVPDFEQVAFKPFDPAMEPYVVPGTPVGDFIMDDDNGPEVLYHLQAHPEELDAILRTPPLVQIKRLTLLAQRFASSQPEAAGSNGAAPVAQVRILPPKPPTPLRTEAQRATPETPAEPDSISAHERAFGRKRR